MKKREVVIISACRTPIGDFNGMFKSVTARDLAITVGKEAIKRAGIDAELIDEIVMGQLYTGMQGSLPARQVSMRIGMAARSNAVSVNQNCASGMRALEIVCDNILLGKTEIGIAIGVESMTNAPYMLDKARNGYRMGPGRIEDSMLYDGLIDDLTGSHMGVTAENIAKQYGITREECDQLSLTSHKRACEAIKKGKFKDEIVPIQIKKKNETQIIENDEHPMHDASEEKLAKLKTVFIDDGVVTAGNAAGINDGAAAVIVMSKKKAQKLGITPLVKMLHICGEGVEPEVMGLGPASGNTKMFKSCGNGF